MTISGAGPSVVRPGHHTTAAAWLVALLVLALGLLNPLACIIHCLPRQVSAPATHESFASMCHIPSPGAPQAPAGAAELSAKQAQTPQAAFAFVAPVLVVLLVGVRRAATASIEWMASPQLFLRPLAPPPR